MNEEVKNKYMEVKELFRRMSHEICVVVESYHIWRTLTFARSIPEVGQEQAEKNAELMGIYKDFFIPTEQSHLQTFIIGLMKFFDRDPRALSFAGLIKIIQNNQAAFTPDVVRNIFPNLESIGAIKSSYIPIQQSTIDHFESFKTEHANLINNLKNIRDKQFAHTDMKTIKATFVPNKVETLIAAIQEIFNELSADFDLSSTIFSHLKEDSIRSTQYLLETLERGEQQRRKEFEEKWSP